jgi:hypothetical protein
MTIRANEKKTRALRNALDEMDGIKRCQAQ